MTKSETVRQLAAASNAARVEALNQQIESLRQAKLTSAEELATLLEPLAQAMAALTAAAAYLARLEQERAKVQTVQHDQERSRTRAYER